MLIVDHKNYEEDEDFEELDEELPERKKRKRKKHSCSKTLGCFIVLLILIVAIVYLLLKFFIGPIVIAVDKLPNDFPKELVILNSQDAEIKIQSPEEKKNLEMLLNYIPDGISALFLNFFTTDAKSQLIQKDSEGISGIKDINIDQIKDYLKDDELKNLKTVSASWTGISRKKEELAEFYRKQFLNKGFEYKENITDYDINLSFWKDNVFGIININDTRDTKTSSDANITVNYTE